MALDKLTQITSSGINSTTPLTGINVTGIITASSLSVSGITTGAAATFDSVDVLGVLTYDDVTNVDALGIVTARSGVHVTSGSVGIGTDNPGNDLEIASSGNTKGLVVTKAGTESAFLGHNGSGNEGLLILREGGTNKIQLYAESNQTSFINTGGSVGIGTDNPSGKLEVSGDAVISHTGANPLDLYKYGTTAPTILMYGANGTAASPTQTLTGDVIGGLNMFGHGSSGFAGGPSVRINAIASENNGQTSNRGADIKIETVATGGTSLQERLRITSAGLVGIGTDAEGASSNTLLTLQATGSTACRFVLANTGSGSVESTQIFSQNNDLAFQANGSERLRITSEGYVTKPNHPCFDAVRNSGHLSAATYINYNTVKVNNGNHYDSSNGRFTAPVAGYYFFSWTSIKNNTNTVTRLYIHKNGNPAYGNRHLRLDGGQDYGDNGTMTAVIQLAKDDYVQIYLTAGSVYGVTEEYCIFNGYLLG